MGMNTIHASSDNHSVKETEWPCNRILKMPAAEIDLIFNSTKHIYYDLFTEDELYKLSDPDTGFLYFVDNYGSAVTAKGGQAMPLDLWPAQRDLIIPAYSSNRDIIVGKTRRFGATTLLAHLFYWAANFKAGAINTNLIYISNRFDNSSDILELIRTIDQYISKKAPWIKIHQLDGKNSTKEISIPGRGVRILAYPPGEQVRGMTASIAVSDEAARLFGSTSPEELLAALEPTTAGGGKLMIISTGNGETGKGELFSKKFWAAHKGEDTNTDAIFMPRSQHPWFNYKGFEKIQLAKNGGSNLRLMREFPEFPEHMFLEDPEGAVFDLEALEIVFELGRRIREQVAFGGLVSVGIDWGGGGTGWVVNRTLANNGIHIPESGTSTTGAPTNQVDMIYAKAKSYSDYLDKEFYDPGGSGDHVNRQWADKYGREMRPWPVPFGTTKRPNRDFLMYLITHTSEQCQKYDFDIGQMQLFLAIDPDKCKDLAVQMRSAKTSEIPSGILKDKKNEQHEFDALLCSVNGQRLDWFRNFSH